MRNQLGFKRSGHARIHLFVRLLATVVLGLLRCTQAQASILAGPVVNPANHHSYYLLTQDTWFASEGEAVVLGGDLATINDAAENNWVYTTFSTYGGHNRGLWIGLNDAVTEGTFEWISGEPVTYTNWAPGEPNAANSNEDYVHIESPAFNGPGWNDRDGNDYTTGSGRWGVVEVVPEPSAWVLVVSGLLVTGVVLRRRYCANLFGRAVGCGYKQFQRCYFAVSKQLLVFLASF